MMHVPADVLAAFGLQRADVTPITTGLINATYRLHAGGRRFVLQRLNPIFGVEVNADILAVTRHLSRKGLATPELVLTEAGATHLVDASGRCWRLLTYVDGHSQTRADGPQMCAQAGGLLGRFHLALADFEQPFQHQRGSVHDTPYHLRVLRDALAQHATHPAHADVRALAEAIEQRVESLPDLAGLPPRVVHGDPKISNILFDEAGRAVCMVDLDTLARMPLALELGDALRSWCNGRAEDDPESWLSVERFDAAIAAYAATGGELLAPEQAQAVVDAVALVATELAARFAADALRECYFAWDAERFGAAWQHHLVRARAQLALARSVRQQRAQLEAGVRRAFAH